MFLDFRKAFDTVDHALLLYKLSFLNLDPSVLDWITHYLTDRFQSVVINGVKSPPLRVTSGVPQGSVLGPLLFLIYINDLPDVVGSSVKLFADDCVVYRAIETDRDIVALKKDLKEIETWCGNWGMTLNTRKCKTVVFSLKDCVTDYQLNDEILQTGDDYKYLGVTISSNLKWDKHVDTIVRKASRALGFLRRNFKSAPREIKITVYQSYVRPILEYASAVWDPQEIGLKSRLEKIQSRAARFVMNNYSQCFRSAHLKTVLGWTPLENRRRLVRVKLLYDIYYGLTGIDSTKYFLPPNYVSSRLDHTCKIQPYYPRTSIFKNSYFVKTIEDWNHLPRDLVLANCSATFYRDIELLFQHS